jgi:hypothetical protein
MHTTPNTHRLALLFSSLGALLALGGCGGGGGEESAASPTSAPAPAAASPAGLCSMRWQCPPAASPPAESSPATPPAPPAAAPTPPAPTSPTPTPPPAPPAQMTMAWVTPETSAALAGHVTFNFVGSGFQDVQIWTEVAGVWTFVARGTISANSTAAVAEVDTRAFPNGNYTFYATGWNAPPDTTATAFADAGGLSISINNVATPAPAASWWRPVRSETWNVQLTGTVDTRIVQNNYGVHLFDTPASSIATFKGRGSRVMCFFSGGIAHAWHSDYARFTAADKGNATDASNTVYWLDTRSANVRAIMAARMDLAVSKGCDAVVPHNLNGYVSNTGKPLSASSQLDYNRWLTAQAHARGLGIGLGNAIGQLAELAPFNDFAFNERCHELSECAGYVSTFLATGKVVYNIETAQNYINNTGGARDALCQTANAQGFNTQLATPNLDGSIRYSCR